MKMSRLKIKLSIFCSIFKGSRFIEHYLRDITKQTIFNECELILIDANSPEGEGLVISEYLGKYKNIKYIRLNKDPGLYACWNIAINESSGQLLNNANLDDSKRIDALEVQSNYLDRNPGIDLVYADSLISNSINCDYNTALLNSEYRYNFPDFSIGSLIDCNPPHQSPVYRRKLHDEFGYFDENYKSASDSEFWLRCASGGANMSKVDEVLGVYYDNPRGVSTNPDNADWKIKEEVEVRDKYKEYGTLHRGNARRIIRNMSNLLSS